MINGEILIEKGFNYDGELYVLELVDPTQEVLESVGYGYDASMMPEKLIIQISKQLDDILVMIDLDVWVLMEDELEALLNIL